MGPAVVVGPALQPELEPKLEVMLATCNGARFLEAQLHSLWQQQRRPDRLLVLDDGSSDGTTAILQRWHQRHPHWIQPLPSSPQRLGPTQAFGRLLAASSAPYVALCDQDDLWLPQRLSTGLRQLQAAETLSPRGHQQPLLVHSDALLIDAHGVPMPQRLWQWHRVSSHRPALWQLALRNQVTGCTVLCNRALLDQALPIPPAAVLHDWWLGLIACREGGLLACPQPLLQHRRHSRNASGPGTGLQRLRRLGSLAARWRQWHAVRTGHQPLTGSRPLRDTGATLADHRQ